MTGSFEPTGSVAAPEINLDFVIGPDRLSKVTDKLIDLHLGIEARNERVLDAFGDQARTLEIVDDHGLLNGDRYKHIHDSRLGFVVMNTLLTYPAGLLTNEAIPGLAGTDVSQTVRDLNRPFAANSQIITARRPQRSFRAYFGWADDLMIIDRRAQAADSMRRPINAPRRRTAPPVTETPPEPVADPVIHQSPEEVRQVLAEARRQREAAAAEKEVARQAEIAAKTARTELEPEAVKERMPEPPTAEEASASDEKVSIRQISAPEAANTSAPKRFLYVYNLAQVNEQATEQIERINARRREQKPDAVLIKPDHLVIRDNTHATFNGADYMTGPLPRSILNKLLENYGNPGMLSMADLTLPINASTGYTDPHAPRKVQSCVRQLEAQGLVYSKKDNRGNIVFGLSPITIITDNRLAPAPPADSQPKNRSNPQHADIIVS